MNNVFYIVGVVVVVLVALGYLGPVRAGNLSRGRIVGSEMSGSAPPVGRLRRTACT